MKNEYEVKGDITVIKIQSRKYGLLETLIDTEDLAKVKQARSWSVNWYPNAKSFYVVGYFENGKHIKLHRFVMGVTEINKHVDHINHDSLDNRKSELRIVTPSENNQNKRIVSNNKSGYTGVFRNKRLNKWQASIRVNGKLKHLGVFEDIKDAVKARKEAERKYFTYKQKIALEGI